MKKINIYEELFKDFVGAIPQVLDDFLHYFGEERIDCNIYFSRYPTKINTLVDYIDMLENGSWDIIIRRYKEYSKYDIKILNIVEKLVTDNKLVLDKNILQKMSKGNFDYLSKSIHTILRFYYGETIADIIVHFPKVTITNENDHSVDIEDLFSKTVITYKGTLYHYPSFTKSTYSLDQWNIGYIHSHVPSVSKETPGIFLEACLGQGPISNTATALRIKSNFDLWPLYCLELDRFTKIESLHGGPYIRLERLNAKEVINLSDDFNYNNVYKQLNEYFYPLLDGFIDYLVEKKPINFIFQENKYHIGSSYSETVLNLSEVFIDYYNNIYLKAIDNPLTLTDLILHDIIGKGEIKNNHIAYVGTNRNVDRSAHGRRLFTFKGKNILLNIKTKPTTEDHLPYLLTNFAVSKIIHTLLTYINHAPYYKTNTERTTNSNKKGYAF